MTTTANFTTDFDVDLPSLEELFSQAKDMGCVTYQCDCIDGEAGGEIGTFSEPDPRHGIVWASRVEVVEIDEEGLTAKVKVWY